MKKNGFTLIELLITIILIAVFGSIIVFSMTGLSNDAKEKDYNRFISTIESAAQVYIDLDKENTATNYANGNPKLTVGKLIDKGLIDEDLKNPYTDKIVNRDDEIIVKIDSETNAIVIEYNPTK